MLLLKSTLSLDVGSLIVVRIRALNSIDWGEYSELNVDGATIEDLPATMDPPYADTSGSLNTAILLTWDVPSAGAGTGGTSLSIDNYVLYWD